ncbi:MAG: polyprenol monophosphomannose synthase [Candidatus Omnitrophota bacterium]|nr:polyprenol monophosphomannose synthase [Candidatus Omnitrophota bacterium]
MHKNIIIIPTYNERKNITKIVEEVILANQGFDILIVDDNSPDGTGLEVDRLAALYPEVQVLHRPAKRGIGKAYLDGFRWVLERNYEYIFEMDGDLSHNPRDLPRLLEGVRGSDLCIGSRYIRGGGVRHWPLWRQALSRMANLYVRLVTQLPIKDTTAGFKCFKRRVLECLPLDKIHSEGYSFQIEMHYWAWKMGFKLKEIPIIFVDRPQGRSKMSRQIIWEAFLVVWKLIFDKEANKPRGFC